MIQGRNHPKQKTVEVRIIASSSSEIEEVIKVLEERFGNVAASRILPNRYEEGFRCYVNLTVGDLR